MPAAVRSSDSGRQRDDEKNDVENNLDKSSGASFDELGDAPHEPSASLPKPLSGFGEVAPPRRLPSASSRSGPSEDATRSDSVASRLQRIEVHRVSDHLRQLLDDRDELAAVRRRVDTLRAKREEDDAALPMETTIVDAALPRTTERKMSTICIVREDDADALETHSWSSLWHDVLCGGSGGGDVDGIDALDVDAAVEGGMCCACDFIGRTTVGDAAPVEKELEEGTATDTAATKLRDQGALYLVRGALSRGVSGRSCVVVCLAMEGCGGA